MIVRTHRVSSFALLFAIQGTIIPAITNKILMAAVIGTLAVLVRTQLEDHQMNEATQFAFAPFTALGVAISLFLGFHNNASYGRWWEARTHWGRQIIIVRDLARFLLGTFGTRQDGAFGSSLLEVKVDDLDQPLFRVAHEIPDSDDILDSSYDWRDHIVILAVAQTHAMRAQLRPHCKSDEPISATEDRDRLLTLTEQKFVSSSRNPANAILLHAAKILGAAHSQQREELSKIDTYSMIHVSGILNSLCEIQTACERIHNTSLPLAYSLLVHRTSFLYVILVPFAMADTMRWWTPVFTAIVAYTFFGLDELARQIQEPFRDEPNCLAMSAMSRTVEIDSMEALGRVPPPFLKPKNAVLM